ncbi:MAG: right-handed parallel beta-helix repeat-containing protein [Prolixibacteraceae bacterium]
MKNRYFKILLIAFAVYFINAEKTLAQKFLHPGIDQTLADMAFMKKQVQAGVQPWKDAFERLKTSTDLQFQVKPYTHVLRGPYGKPNIGGDDLSKGSNMAYNCALMGYLTGERAYSEKAIEIINAWSPVIWDLDYNDAKLLAGWTGHILCNAAEILRYTDSGWKQKEIDRFTQMLMTVYYPLIRYYYPQANGNWDGAIIHTILAMAIFTDNHEMFNNAIDHFYHSPVNGSIFKYVYPSGQCQESMRDQGHVQLGLGEFAGAAIVAFTQGVDLFQAANNRIALGYEYTAQFLLGKTPHCYGKISERSKDLRDDYEYVYRHYAAQGIELPFTKKAADSIRIKASRSVLTAFRAPTGKAVTSKSTPAPSPIAYPAGALDKAVIQPSNEAIRVTPGQSIQAALDAAALQAAAGKNGWVLATAGIHKLPGTLKIPSGITLSGEGLSTVLLLDPASGLRDAIVNATEDLHDVTICDLVLEGSTTPEIPSDPNSNRSYRGGYNRGGIMFLGTREGALKNITFRNLTVRNCTYNGIFLTGATNLKITCCDLNENGASVPPGARQLHNLLLSHCSAVSINGSRMDTSPLGCGIVINYCSDVSVNNCETARNGWYGILVSESKNISFTGNLVEGNDAEGIMFQFLYNGSENISLTGNLIHYNQGFGIASYASKNLYSSHNIFAGNGTDLKSNEKISPEKYINMQ